MKSGQKGSAPSASPTFPPPPPPHLFAINANDKSAQSLHLLVGASRDRQTGWRGGAAAREVQLTLNMATGCVRPASTKSQKSIKLARDAVPGPLAVFLLSPFGQSTLCCYFILKLPHKGARLQQGAAGRRCQPGRLSSPMMNSCP